MTESNFMWITYYVTLFMLIFSVSFHLAGGILFITVVIILALYPQYLLPPGRGHEMNELEREERDNRI